MDRWRLFAIDEDVEKKANILIVPGVAEKRARRQHEAKQQRSQKLGVVASRSRRQAEMKQQRTAAAVVATMTQSRCKGEPTQPETSQIQEQIQYKP